MGGENDLCSTLTLGLLLAPIARHRHSFAPATWSRKPVLGPDFSFLFVPSLGIVRSGIPCLCCLPMVSERKSCLPLTRICVDGLPRCSLGAHATAPNPAYSDLVVQVTIVFVRKALVGSDSWCLTRTSPVTASMKYRLEQQFQVLGSQLPLLQLPVFP